MQNYFKTYYKTRLTKGVLGEQASELNQQLTTEALSKHKNIMEGYNPDGRESGIMDPETRAKYIKHFTNFIKEQFNDGEFNWIDARNMHDYVLRGVASDIIETSGRSYVSQFTDFMNAPSTNIILEAHGEEHDVKNTGLPPMAGHIRSHGDLFDKHDRIWHHTKMLKYALDDKSENEIKRHSAELKRLGADVEAIVRDHKKKD